MAKKQSAKDEPGLFGETGEPQPRIERVELANDDSLDRILADLKSDVGACAACKPGMPIVFGVGAAPAELMVIGEGPGIDDIPTERPFEGQAGLLLTRMLAAINRARQECYLCNVIKCVPPGERVFAPEEVEGCRPYLLRQIAVVRPRVILALGALAAQTLLRSKETISKLRGRAFPYQLNDVEIALVPTFNPAYLLRIAEKKRESWEDLKLVRDLLGG